MGMWDFLNKRILRNNPVFTCLQNEYRYKRNVVNVFLLFYNEQKDRWGKVGVLEF